MTDYDFSTVDYAICPDHAPNKFKGYPRHKCDTGCGRIVVYRAEIPATVPKVCQHCSTWLSDCKGEA